MLSLEQLSAAFPRNGAWRIVARMPGKGVGGTWFGNVTVESDLAKWEMNLRSIDIYSLPNGFDGDHGLPVAGISAR